MNSKNSRLALFTSLYFSQGAILSYFLTFNILYLGEAGYQETDVGIFQAILVLPFILKIFLGMLSDSVNLFGWGHRKPYIIIGLITQSVMMLLAPHISVSTGLGGFALVAFIASTGMALYDTCTDGLALDTTPEDQRGVVQGMMVSGRAAGVLTILLIGGWIVDKFGWTWVFYIVAAVALMPLLLINVVEESKSQVQRESFTWQGFTKFRQPSVMLLVLVGILYSVSLEGVLTFLSDHLRDILQISIGNVGVLIAFSMVGRIFGALLNNRLTDKIGHQKSLFLAIAIATIGCFGLAIPGGVVIVGIFSFVFGAAYGYYTAVYAAVAMDLSDPRISASMFAIFMMFLNIGLVGGQVLGGFLTESWGFGAMVLVMGALNLVNLPLIRGIFKKLTFSRPLPVDRGIQ